jgi:HlyD family secretion protein
MTATATIVTDRRPDQLLVPNAALRFVPPIESRFGGPRAQATTGTNVWIMRDGVPTPVPVETHGTDGRNTSITGEGIAVGVEVLTGLAREDGTPEAPEAE